MIQKIHDYGGGLRHTLAADSLRGADLHGADLMCAALDGADLTGADLRGADLRGIRLRGAHLEGINVAGARLNWSCRELIGEILRQAAGDDPAKTALALEVSTNESRCWPEWVGVDEPLEAWYLGVLLPFVTPGDRPPNCLCAPGSGGR